ncbi:hypothetical protein BJ878DRAFT_567680 [Calycina marina]|uniref:histidine kinase n=1 Tax=Calycina marina TaxID=1763456 RepID=A0A9P8CF00_9HELO|nr:hypothetical protein BJ878DRAFT_567680 [Calycina marina]
MGPEGMTHPLKSPSDAKPSSTFTKRPSNSRRSSSDKSNPKSTKSSKHGIRDSSRQAEDSMSSQAMATKGDVDIRLESASRGPSSSPTTSSFGTEGPSDKVQGRRSSIGGKMPGVNAEDVPLTLSTEGGDRVTINARLQLNRQRQNLAQQLEGQERPKPASILSAGGKSRVSPIHEETASPSTIDYTFAAPNVSALETASTESAKTIRGGVTPSILPMRTPSFPFPNMRTPGSYVGHRPFTALSPTINPANYAGGQFDGIPYDQVLSGSITPASTLQFQPAGAEPEQSDLLFPTPNLYDLSLMLSAAPGLDAWWTTVVQVMRAIYKADRISLSVPADSTDVENVPWGQKATYNACQDDQLSLTYLPRGSSMIASSNGTNDTSNSGEGNTDESPPMVMLPRHTRPGLLSRHSFTSYEDTKRAPQSVTDPVRPTAARPAGITRAQSYLSTRPEHRARGPVLQNAQLNLQSLQDHMNYEDAKEKNTSPSWENNDATAKDFEGRVFSVLQALDYEVDPLIDSSGVLRVLDRGKVIALTRDYPYLDDANEEQSGSSGKSTQSGRRAKESDQTKKPRVPPELASRLSSFLKTSRRSTRTGQEHAGERNSMPFTAAQPERPRSPRYEEYEQAPPSPWAQSPAPSPAIRVETAENPFFADKSVDEESFNPTVSHDYSTMQSVEAIGVDRSWTVLHVPLSHPLLSKPVQSMRLDAATMESKSKFPNTSTAQLPKLPDSTKTPGVGQTQEKRTPIAILSILSPVIPYPSNLRHSLEHLAPHLATSFSLCRNYTNLENEIAGLSRKRPQTSGFGPIASVSRRSGNLPDAGSLSYHHLEAGLYGHIPERSSGGSITSPSDYSVLSRSTAGSPGGTPGWGPGTVGLTMDRKSSGGSPGPNSNESYFSAHSRLATSGVDTGSASSIAGARRSNENSPSDSRSQNPDERSLHRESLSGRVESLEKVNEGKEESDSTKSNSRQGVRHRELYLESSEGRDMSPSRQHPEALLSPRRQAMRAASHHIPSKVDSRSHTQLHSYGADFGSTFQSLPSTSIPNKLPVPPVQSRKDSTSLPTDMPPPSDRLKGLMLDSLPAHVFVALPQTGEIVWVNNRYLTYRGQSVPQLYEDPWGSIHPEDREAYLKAWSHAIKTGEQFSVQARIRRFDGAYRWFYTRAVGSRDLRGIIVQWYGSHMDIHDQHIAEVKAARQEEIEASEVKHRQLANLIPQIIFAATEEDGVTFANEQWLSYTGQESPEALGLGFLDYIHPDDLSRCAVPFDRSHTPQPRQSPETSGGSSGRTSSEASEAPTEATIKPQQIMSRNNSSNSSLFEFPAADLAELTRTGVLKIATDSDGNLSYTTEMRLRNKVGEYRWHLVRCVEVDNMNLGSGNGSWLCACTDINDHKLLEAKLKEAMESKGKFLSNMSHEIRTPLIGISGMVNFLQDTTLNDEQSDYANTIASSARSLLNIINDILDLSKVDAGMMKLSHEWFHFRSLVEEVNEMVSTLAITKRLELNYVVDTEVPEMVKGDKFRMRQVLLNVIGNAIKFTSVGEVFTRCRLMSEGVSHLRESEVMVEFSIIDSGQGFTQEEGDMIFKPFSQIDGSSTRQHGGSGLGLVISRQLVELHGGKMEGSAIPGKGSTFKFTVIFGVATPDDHPEPLSTPALQKNIATMSSITNEISARAMKQAGGNPILANKFMQSPAAFSPGTETSLDSPTVMSSGSSNPSLHSFRSDKQSSTSSVAHSLSHFNEAALASQQDRTQMKLALPDKHVSTEPRELGMSNRFSTNALMNEEDLSRPGQTTGGTKHLRPRMYSILLVCSQIHSREATTQHIEVTLPKDIPHQITPLSSADDARQIIGGADPVLFTHIVLNLPSAEEVVSLMEQILTSTSQQGTSIVVLSDPVQRQEVLKMGTLYNYQAPENDHIHFVYKPVKPSRFATVFDPDKERDISTDKNRSSAQQQVANQKQNYLDVGKRLGHRGLKVLLVEDNVVNQKVLLKYLSKVGIDVDLALDGVECTDKVFAQSHSYYSLILCDLHMPRKDGHQTCRDIREWEANNKFTRMPIIALSANVMADVLQKCVQAGFNSYVTKPIDFKELSAAMSNLLDPSSPEGATSFVSQT